MARQKSGKESKETNFSGQIGQSGKQSRNAKEDSSLSGEYDPRYNGPNKNRSCTDIICCLLFILFLGGQAVVMYFAYVYGDPKLLLYPQDSNGNMCGVGSKADQKYLFFFDLSVCGRMGPAVFVNGCPTPQVCVSKCPSTNYFFLASLHNADKSELICKDGVDTNSKSVQDLVKDGDCAPYYLSSSSVMHRCLPIKELLEFGDNVMTIGNQNVTDSSGEKIAEGVMESALEHLNTFLKVKEFGEKVVADVVTSWWMILVGLVVAMVLSLIWITLMRWLAGVMVWLTVFAFVVIWMGLTGACWYLYYQTRGSDETMTFYLVWRMSFKKENIFLAGGIGFGVILVVVLLILLFLCQRIRIAIALINQGSRAVGAMWSTLLFPLVPFILQVGVVALWGCTATFLASVGRGSDHGANNITNPDGSFNFDAIKDQSNGLFVEVPCDVNDTTTGGICNYIKYGKGDYTIYLQIYNLFMLFWLINFVSALGQLTLSGAFASWYWAYQKPRDIPSLPLLFAFGRCFRYHLGSLAFGSLLIAIVQIIRVVLEYLDHKLKGSENPVAKFFLKCLKCCFWCLEKFLKFLCKNAYIMMAVYGKNFCRSAVKAFELILKNCVRAFVLDKVTDFLMFVCKLVVLGAVGVMAYFFFDGRIQFLSEYTPKLNFYIVPIIIVILASYLVADVFFSVYEMAIDTVFLCFLEDVERNDGSREKPYFMSKGLMKILGKANKKLKDKTRHK